MQPTIEESQGPQFSWAGGEAVHPDREARVHFKQCVRVVPIGGPPRAYRVLAANLSRQGMFLKMPTPFDMGTRVALSLEAGGRVLPFAQAEVVWRNLEESKQPGRGAGFGVRFTGFLHPRAHELVNYLVDNLGTGKPLVSPQPKAIWHRRLAWLGAGVMAVVVGAVITTGVLHLVRASKAEPSGGGVQEVGVGPVTPPDEVTPSTPDEVEPLIAAGAPREEEYDVPVEAAVLVPPPEVAKPEPVVVAKPPVVKPEPVIVAKAAVVKPEPVVVARSPAVKPDPKPAEPKARPAKAEAPRGLAIPSGAVKSVGSTLNGSDLTLSLELASGASIARAFTLTKPDRLALDVTGPLPRRSYVLTGSNEVVRVRVGRIAGGTRLVVDLSRAPGKPTLSGALVIIPLR